MRTLDIKTNFTKRDSESFKMHLKEMNRYALLSQEEEVELARRAHRGDTSARERLINSNMRFVVSIAKQYPTYNALSLEDLVSEGQLGLIEAVDRFDESRGCKLISYAVSYIRKNILEALDNHSTTIRVPSNRKKEMARIKCFIKKYEQTYGFPPSDDEIAQALDINVDGVEMLRGLNGNTVSLSTPLKDGEDSTLYDVIPDNESDAADAGIECLSNKHEVRRLINSLPHREQKIINLYFGIDGEEMRLDEIAPLVNLSYERTRQLYHKACATLRSLRIMHNCA